jgi:hypothetical protein
MNFKSQIQVDVMNANQLGGKFTDSDMLASAYQVHGKPHEFGNKMTQLFASKSKFWEAKPLLGSTEAQGKFEEVDYEVFRWYLEGAEDCAARSVEKMVADGSRPGLNGEVFEIKLNEKWFSKSEVITGEHEDYPLEIVDMVGFENGGYVYKVKLASDINVEFPEDLLEKGMEFTKVYNINNIEFTRERGGQTYNQKFRMESQIGTFGQEIMVTDKVFREDARTGTKTKTHDGDYLAVPYTYMDKNGKKKSGNKFMMMAQAKMYDELEMSKEYALWLGQKYTSMDDNGYVKRMGPGLRQQMQDGWIQRYSGALTEKMLQEYLMDIFFSRLSQGERKVKAMTGTSGSIIFHDLLAASASSFLTVDSNYVQKTSNGPTSNNLQYGAQFTKYIGVEGLEVEVWYNPLYDSLKYSKRKHPQYKDRPLDSYRMTFLDFGTTYSEGIPKDNIRMLKLKNYYGYGWKEGIIDYMGNPKKGESVTDHNLAGVVFYADDSAGINVIDPTRCGELILDFEA